MPAKPDPGGRVESRNRSWSVRRTERRAPRWHHRNVDLPARSQIRSRVTSSRSANENYVTARVESDRRILAYRSHFAQRFSSWQCRRRIEFPVNSQRLADTEPIVRHYLPRTRVNDLCLWTEMQVQVEQRAKFQIYTRVGFLAFHSFLRFLFHSCSFCTTLYRFQYLSGNQWRRKLKENTMQRV